MTTELAILAWLLVLALVQILLTARLRTRETGLRRAGAAFAGGIDHGARGGADQLMMEPA